MENNKEIYLLVTVHETEDYKVSTLIDAYTTFDKAEAAARNNADAQKKIEAGCVIAEWEHEGYFPVPTFNFLSPLYTIETVSEFMNKVTKTYRAIFISKLE